MVGKEDVEPEEEPEGDVQIEGHSLLDAGAEDLHRHLSPSHSGSVHLAEAGRCERRLLKFSKELRDRTTQLLLNHPGHRLDGVGGSLVLKGPDQREVWLRKNVRSGTEELGQLDEGGPQPPQDLGQAAGPPLMMCRAPNRGPANEEVPTTVP
jgi:hypothetical protein